MFQQLPHTGHAVSFIGAGLAMVAYGASAAVGLVEEGDATRQSSDRDQRQPVATEREDLGRCMGRRLDVYAHRGC
ncbi:hypothetical protein [Acidovorax sp.]|uniref:hypothetical protein n=1 Tax=Acidovorax sp. TaxID=1872122 RepID=UPI00391FB90A